MGINVIKRIIKGEYDRIQKVAWSRGVGMGGGGGDIFCWGAY